MMNAAVLHSQTPRKHAPNRFRIGQLLLLKDKARQFIGSTTFGHGNSALQHDGTMIILVVGEVYGTATDMDSASYGRFMDVMTILAVPAECRDQ